MTFKLQYSMYYIYLVIAYHFSFHLFICLFAPYNILFPDPHWVCFNAIVIKYPFPMIPYLSAYNRPFVWSGYMVHYGINHAGVQVTQWDIRNKETSTRPARRSFFFKVPLCYQHPSMANDVPCMHVTGQIMQRAYFYVFLIINCRRS